MSDLTSAPPPEEVVRNLERLGKIASRGRRIGDEIAQKVVQRADQTAKDNHLLGPDRLIFISTLMGTVMGHLQAIGLQQSPDALYGMVRASVEVQASYLNREK